MPIEAATLHETAQVTRIPTGPRYGAEPCALREDVRRLTAHSETEDKAAAIARARAEGIQVWEGQARVFKFQGDSVDEADLYEIVDGTPNLLSYGGASALWHRVTGGSSVAAFSNANAAIGVGDSSTAAAATQTDLVAATNKAYIAMDATYPIHTDATTSGGASIQFRSTAATGVGNFAWQEWAVFNNVSSGRMLNRKVESLGTKTSASTWQLLLTLTLA
jgi:hypothetical protein